MRSLYVNCIAYLLDALPPQLSDHEAALIESKLPSHVRHQQQEQRPIVAASYVPHERSYLHRLIAASIFYFFLFLHFIVPHVRNLLSRAYEYERSHRVTERTVATALYAADKLGRGGINMGSAIMSMNEGKVGTAMSDLAGWWVESIAGGFYEGIGEGMSVLLGVDVVSSRPLSSRSAGAPSGREDKKMTTL